MPLATAADVRTARQAVAAVARSAGLGVAAVGDAAVVASELATNAVVHGGAPASLSVSSPSAGVVWVEVGDARPPAEFRFPPPTATVRNPADAGDAGDADGGWGLHICVALCASVTVRPRPDGGKVVCAVLTDDGPASC